MACNKCFLIVSLSIFLLSCGGGGGDNSTPPPAPAPQPTNAAPTANAGVTQTVSEQVLVHLSGSGSDSDGSISSYHWTQTAGASVKMHASDTAEISFDAPAAAAQSILTFQLLVTDNDGATNSDSVDITVNSNPVPKSAIWEPSLISECVTGQNISPVVATLANTMTDVGQILFEPSILYSDQAFTWFEKAEPGVASMISTALRDNGYEVVDSDDKSLVFDDGTHGDFTAGDGIYTRDCVYVPVSTLDYRRRRNDDEFVSFQGIWVLDAELRNTEVTSYIAEGIRVNDAGFFIELGEDYQRRFEYPQSLTYISYCQACAMAWQLSGDVFDFFVLGTRDHSGGVGYARIHDNILGTGFNPPCEPRSYCYDIIDGQEHQKLTGIVAMRDPSIGGLNHELGHGFLGIETRDFPVAGARAWNAGDLWHLDSDITVTGELAGPFWDPIRGYPYAVKLENDQGHEAGTYLTEDDQGDFRLKSLDDNNRIWDDILLYMMGLMPPEEVTKTYYKLLNPSLDNCVNGEWDTICSSDLVTAEEVIPFTVDDFISQFGTRSVPDFFDPRQIQMGVLNVSDRPHTDAEIVWFTNVYRDFVTSTNVSAHWSTGETTWHWATKGLSTININAQEFIQ